MKVLILLTRNYIELGQAIKAKKYINEAHFISRQFDDPLFIGMIYNQMAKIALLEEDLSSSIDAFNEAIDLFQIVDSRLSLLGALFDITIVYIFQSEINKAISQQKKAQRLIKKYDIKKFKVKFGVIELVIRCLKDELNNSDLIDAVTQLKGVNNRNLYLEWWLLARCYYQLEEFNHADECHSIAKKSINEILDGISHDADKKYYKNNNQHYSQIHSPLMGFIKKEKLEISFCSQCGQKVEPGFTFCAGCGNKLIA